MYTRSAQVIVRTLTLLPAFVLLTSWLAAAESSAPPRPPMGWNSYDAYHAAITEKQFLAVTAKLAERMLPHGYEYAVIDYLWFHPGPPGWDSENNWHTWIQTQTRDPATGQLTPRLVIDEFGRPQPAVNRFPSAANGQGLRAIADHVHAKGMKLGLHIMRGIPTQAVDDNLPVRGTSYRMQDIAERSDTSSFIDGQFTGVNVDHPGAQAYYDDLIQMYADWGVDFIKADDMLRPAYHFKETEMIHRAIAKTGRPILLSLSYGEVSASYAHHLAAHSNLWRISADFWDRWPDLRRNFELAHIWSPHIAKPGWPDLDMIPLGKLMLTGWNFKATIDNMADPMRKSRDERHDHFTPDERQTLMTLWCIARSPLMWGGDPLTSNEETYQILTNPEVLAVNQHGRNPRQILGHGHKDDTLRAWASDAPDAPSRYVALFNLRDEPATVSLDLTWDEMRGSWNVRNLWTRQAEPTVTDGKLSRQLPPHGSALFKLSR